jgi:pimeloyl-ACP methyl ester carboxylesterase
VRPRAAAVALVVASCACVAPGSHEAAPPGTDSGLEDPAVRWHEIEGAWLRVRDVGQGPAVVLVHGFGLSLGSFSELQRALRPHHRVIAYDQRGFGRSERPAGEYGTARHARDLALLVQRLGLQRPVLVGHSYGAGVALAAARQLHGRVGGGAVGGVVLVDGLLLEEQRTMAMRWARAPVVGELIFGVLWAGRPDEDVLLAFDDPARHAALDTLDDFRRNLAPAGTRYAALATVRGLSLSDAVFAEPLDGVPVALAWCERDRVTPFAHARSVVASLPDATLTRLRGCGHMPAREQPEALAELVELIVEQGGERAVR